MNKKTAATGVAWNMGFALISKLLFPIVGILIGAVFVSSLMGGKLYFSSETSVHVQQQARQAGCEKQARAREREEALVAGFPLFQSRRDEQTKPGQ